MPNTLIDLIRHGEPEGGRAYRGNTIDDPLSNKGWQQMWDAVGNTSPWQSIISSPMQRCHAFATALAEKNGLTISVNKNFREIGFGEWEGRTPQEIKSTNLQQYTAFYQDPVNARPPGAEPLGNFISRVTSSYEQLISTYKGKHILIVAHAGVIRAIIAHALNAPAESMYRMKINNGGISRIIYNDIAVQLELLNGKL